MNATDTQTTSAGPAPLQGQYAGCLTRLIAFFLDVAIVTVTLLLLSWIVNATLGLMGIDLRTCAVSTTDRALARILVSACRITLTGLLVVAAAFAPVYALVLWTLAGQTLGKAAMGVRVVRMDGKPMTLWTSIRRLVGYVVTLCTLGIGFFWVLVDNRRQAVHDKVANTCVIYSWEARQNDRLLQRIDRIQRRLRRVGSKLEMADLSLLYSNVYWLVAMTVRSVPESLDLWDQLKQWNEEDPSRVVGAGLAVKDPTGAVTFREAKYAGGQQFKFRSSSPEIREGSLREMMEVIMKKSTQLTAVLAVVVEESWLDHLPGAQRVGRIDFEPDPAHPDVAVANVELEKEAPTAA